MTPKRIIAAVAFAAGTTPARLRDLKNPAFAHCRYVAMHIMSKRFPDLTHKEIASVFGHESNTPVSRANTFLAKAKRENAPAAALLTLATGLLDGKRAAWQIVPVKLWAARRKPPVRKPASKPVQTAPTRVKERVRIFPHCPRGWLLPEKQVAALYRERNYRGAVPSERRAGA